MSHRTYAVIACALVAMTTAATPSAAVAADGPTHIRGTIISSTATSMTVRTASGRVDIVLTPKTGYAGATAGSPADIKPGTFLGIASVPSGGTSKALEVTVFPDSMRGTGEGDYPWDLSAGGSHSAMTNGSVAKGGGSSHSMMTNGSVAKGGASSHSMMTNGNVSKAGGGMGTTVTLTYKGGSRAIAIPANAAIVKLEPGSRKLLATDAHVFVKRANAASGITAAFVVVGEHGTIPPM